MKHVLRSRIRHFRKTARELLFPSLEEDALTRDARIKAAADWEEIFAPLAPLVSDAAVLEIGCGDGAMLASLLDRPTGAARTGIGIAMMSGDTSDAAGASRPDFRYLGERLELHGDSEYLESLDPDSVDLLVCRDMEQRFALPTIESGLKRLYDILRPGAEAVVTVGCFDPAVPSTSGPGYGFLTPTTWTMLLMRAGFEIVAERRIWRDQEQAAVMARLLPCSSEEERMTREIRLRLVRPWESWELEKVWAGKGA